MNKLGVYVKNYRQDLALNQTQFADKINVSVVTISNLENGAHIGAKLLRALSKELNVNTRELRRYMLEDHK